MFTKTAAETKGGSPLKLRGWLLWERTPDRSPSLGSAQQPPAAGSTFRVSCVRVCVARGRGRGTERGDAATHLSPQFAEHHAVWTDKSPVPRKISQEGPRFSPVNEPCWPANANSEKEIVALTQKKLQELFSAQLSRISK